MICRPSPTGGRLFEADDGTDARRFLYDGWMGGGGPSNEIIAEYDDTGTMLHRYVRGPGADEVLVEYDGDGMLPADKTWLHHDERGSVIAGSKNNGAMDFINLYDEFGNPGAGNEGSFQYTGQLWLAEAGLYHYKARAYNPDLGRFMQTDPIGYADGLNMYAYVGGDPVNGSDPSGLQRGEDPELNQLIDYDPNYDDDESPSCGSRLSGVNNCGGAGGGADYALGGAGGFSGGITGVTGPRGRNTAVCIDGACTSQTLRPTFSSLGFGPGFNQAAFTNFPLACFEDVCVSSFSDQLFGPGQSDGINDLTVDMVLLAAGGPVGRAIMGALTFTGRTAGTALSSIRYTAPGEAFFRYETNAVAFSRITANGGVRPGTYAAPVSDGFIPVQSRVATYALPDPQLVRSVTHVLRPPAGTLVIGPRSVQGGTGVEVLFPLGF